MIELFEGFYMTADDAQFIVGKARKRPTRRFSVSHPRYYASLEMAVADTAERATREKVASGEITTLRGFLDEYRHLKAQIEAAVTP